MSRIFGSQYTNWSLLANWNQWALPLSVWWSSIKQDRAGGVQLGPLHLMWQKYPEQPPGGRKRAGG